LELGGNDSIVEGFLLDLFWIYPILAIDSF
jgi:hypothetical protein